MIIGFETKGSKLSELGSLDLSKVEKAICGIDVVRVGLLVELNVVADNGWGQLRDVGEVKGLKDLIDMGEKVSHGLLVVSINTLSCLGIDYTAHQVPSEVFLDVGQTVQSHYLGQDGSGTNI